MRRRRVARNEPLVTRGAAARSLAKSGQQRRLSRVAGPNSREPLGLRERKKARLRQQIIDTSIRLFRKHGYENTRVEDIVQILDSGILVTVLAEQANRRVNNLLTQPRFFALTEAQGFSAVWSRDSGKASLLP